MTELREGILRNQIRTLEGQANKLEQMVYFQIAGLPDDQEEMDGRILRQLLDMDRLQTEIDQLSEKLKAEGYWEPASYTDCKYIYTRPKAKPKPKKEPRKPRKVYPSETTEQRKKREAVAEKKRLREEKLAAKEAAKAEREAAKADKPKPEPKPKAPPKPKPVPVPKPPRPKPEPKPKVSKPRKPAESREVVLLKKRKAKTEARMKELEERYEPKRLELEGRVQHFEAKLAELAEVSWKDRGHQKRATARGHMQNAQKQLEELPETFEAKRKSLEDQLAKHERELTEQFAKEAS